MEPISRAVEAHTRNVDRDITNHNHDAGNDDDVATRNLTM